jgi:uncharacterized protein (TIGR00730 family)
MDPTAPSVCVFCGARAGLDPAYADATRATAEALAATGCRLVYGGGNVGLMGVLADAALEHGVHVTGVIPSSMVRTELAHQRIQRLVVVETMHERKAVMARESDAVLALPGGVGTLDELFETMTWNQLNLHRKPIGLLDLEVGGAGFYAGLLALLRHGHAGGFILPGTMDLLLTGKQPMELLGRVLAARAPTPLAVS